MPLNINWQQILLHLFNLVLLFTILTVLLYNPIRKFMDKRKKYYDDMDNKAKQNLEDSVAKKEEYENRIKGVNDEISDMREKATKNADIESENIIASAKAEADKIISDAKVEAAREKAHSISEANQEISKMVADATEKIVFKDTDSAYESFLNNVEGSEKDAK